MQQLFHSTQTLSLVAFEHSVLRIHDLTWTIESHLVMEENKQFANDIPPKTPSRSCTMISIIRLWFARRITSTFDLMEFERKCDTPKPAAIKALTIIIIHRACTEPATPESKASSHNHKSATKNTRQPPYTIKDEDPPKQQPKLDENTAECKEVCKSPIAAHFNANPADESTTD
eukprot:58381_1